MTGDVGSDYAFASQFVSALFWPGLGLTAVGVFLERDGYRLRKIVAHVTTVTGAMTFVVSKVVAQHAAIIDELDCSLWGEGCPSPDESIAVSAYRALVGDALSPTEWLPPLLAIALGWGAAALTKRGRAAGDGEGTSTV